MEMLLSYSTHLIPWCSWGHTFVFRGKCVFMLYTSISIPEPTYILCIFNRIYLCETEEGKDDTGFQMCF